MLPYFQVAQELLARLQETQQNAIESAAELVADSLLADGVWHVFGTGHSHLLAEEVYYRAGGLAPVNAILFPALMQHEGPATSTLLERQPGLARIVLEKQDVRPGEVLTIVSNSGKNAVPVEMAVLAREKGLKTVAITSLTQTAEYKEANPAARTLADLCDIVIDNGGIPGDAILEIPGCALRTAPTSSLAGIAIMQQIVFTVCCRFVEAGKEPPVFKSANLPGGDAWNQKLIARYGARVNLR